jgi:hypothetical protein
VYFFVVSLCAEVEEGCLFLLKRMLQEDLRLGGGNQTVATDALFAGLGAFDSSSGIMFTKGDEIQRAHWHTYIFKSPLYSDFM